MGEEQNGALSSVDPGSRRNFNRKERKEHREKEFPATKQKRRLKSKPCKDLTQVKSVLWQKG